MRILLIIFMMYAGCTTKYFFPEAPHQDPDYENHVGKFEANQFRIVVLYDDEQTRIRMEIRYTVGSNQDPPGKAGLAHLVEHLMFEVPINDEPNAESFGTVLSHASDDWNAYTTLDSTSYLSVFTPERLKEVFALEIVRMKRGCLGLKEKDFLRAREIVRNEAREYAHRPGQHLQKALREFIYSENHPYRTSTLGTDKTISTLTQQDACHFIQDHYIPRNTVIVVSGPVGRHQMQDITQLWMRSFSTKKRPKKLAKQKYLQVAEQTKRLDVPSPYLVAVWPLDKKGTKKSRLQSLSIGSLNQSISEQVGKHSWAITSGSMIVGGAEAPALATVIILRDAKDIPKAKKLIELATKKVLASNDNIKNRFAEQRNLLLEYESHSARSGLFADYAQFAWSGTLLSGQLKELKTVTTEQLTPIAKELFGNTRPRFLTILPDSNIVNESTPGDFHYTFTSPKQQRRLAPSVETIAKVQQDLPLPSHLGEAQPFQRYQLPNGLNVLLWQNNDLPLVHTRLLIPVGASHVPVHLKGISNLLRGADDYDVTVFSSTFMSQHAHVALYKLAKDFKSTKRIHNSEEFAFVQDSLRTEQNRITSEYRSRWREAIYGPKHPYTRVEYDSASLARLTPSVVQSWAKSHRTVRGATLIITGRFDPKLMYRHILYHFQNAASFAPRQDAQNQSPTPTPNTGQIVIGYQEARQSMKLSVAFRGKNGIGALQPARDILTTILNSRIHQLRERRALTYGMHATYSPERGLGSWQISGDVDTARSAEATTALLDIISELRSNPSGYIHEFADARRIALARFTRAQLTAAQSAKRLTYLTRYDLEDDYFESYAQALARLRPSDIEGLLKREFALNQAVIGLLGPKKSVSAAKQAITQTLTVE